MSNEQKATVYFVRHGVTPETGKILYGLTPGKNLSELGHAQAECVADALEEMPITTIYHSPLERAEQTAQPLAKRRGLMLQPDARFIECDPGEFTGMTFDDYRRGEHADRIRYNPDGFRFPGGESFNEIWDRFNAGIADVVSQHAGESIAIFSHGDPITMGLANAVRCPLNEFQRFLCSPASISITTYRDEWSELVKMNDVSHLAKLPAH